MSAKMKAKRIVQAMLLKHTLKRFENAHKAAASAGFGLLRKKRRYFSLKVEEERQCKYRSSYSTPALPSDVPKGHLAVYVGKERSRFIIPTTYLNHYIFRALLEISEQEFGFDHQMGLTIPCQRAVFEYLTSLLGRKHIPCLSTLQLDVLIDGTHIIS